MKFIAESVIDKNIERLSQAVNLDKAVAELAEVQPALIAYLSSDNVSAFSDEEKDFLFFATLVIYKSIEAVEKVLPELTSGLLTEKEEANFEILSTSKGKTFRDKITVFFENYPQEDLLAFVEDSLEEDEDSVITKEGREYIFVMLKTIIDSFS